MTKTIAQKPWEVKLHAFRRTQDGIVVSFVIHPQECPRALALDDLGTRYGMALARIEDTPSDGPETPASPPEKKDRQPFHTLRRSAQAAMACQDVAFQRWICGDDEIPNEKLARAWILAEFGISGRAELNDERFETHWADFYARFQQETGRVPEVR